VLAPPVVLPLPAVLAPPVALPPPVVVDDEPPPLLCEPVPVPLCEPAPLPLCELVALPLCAPVPLPLCELAGVTVAGFVVLAPLAGVGFETFVGEFEPIWLSPVTSSWLILAIVRGPAMPSTVRPLARWKAWTAAVVAGP
jgi:hypothetical protein